MKNLTDYIIEAYEHNYNISNVPKYTSTGTDKVGKTNNKETVQPKTKGELMNIITNAFENKQYDLNFINTNKITNMSYLFTNCEYNFDVSNWDMSNVTDTNYMFNGCNSFDCDLSTWDVSNVTYMSHMFSGCNNFKGKGLENWNISKAQFMNSMFEDCKKFNCDLSRWDVSKVKDMKYMFYCCTEFEGKGLDKWNLSKRTDIRYIFDGKNKKIIDKVKMPKWAKERYYNFL